MAPPDNADRFFVSFDKTTIRYRRHLPEGQKPAQRILVLHGAQEHSGRYDEFARFLAARGIAVYAPDLRGYGLSGGIRAFTDSFQSYRGDLAALLAIIRREGEEGPAPLLFGHSLGGLIAAHVAASPEFRAKISGLILSSPCFGLAFAIPRRLRLLTTVLSVLRPGFFHRTTLSPALLTHDAEALRRYCEDPLIVPGVTARLFALMAAEMGRARAIGAGISCPALVLQAGDDRIVAPAKTREFFGFLASSDRTFKLYDGLYHELLQETCRTQIHEEIFSWIIARFTQLRS